MSGLISISNLRRIWGVCARAMDLDFQVRHHNGWYHRSVVLAVGATTEHVEQSNRNLGMKSVAMEVKRST